MGKLESFQKIYENEVFVSSSSETPQFRAFASGFKKALMADLKSSSLELASFSKGHFYVTGFLEHAGKYVYFSVGDVRIGGAFHWKKVLYRTAKNTRDFTGGINQYCEMGSLVESVSALLGADLPKDDSSKEQLLKTVKKVIETEAGVAASVYEQEEDELFAEMEFTSPAGEDFVFSVSFDGTWAGFCRGFKAYANGFDADEHASELVGMRGKNGVPSSVRAIIDDAESIKSRLEEIAKSLDDAAYRGDWTSSRC